MGRAQKRLFRGFIVTIFLLIVSIGLCYLIVAINARNRIFNEVGDIPRNEVGLLLGTSPVTPNGEHNYYFDNRIFATVNLYRHGKIKKIIASGGNYTAQNGCDELRAMHDSLISYGIPDSVVILDYQGLRTLNSIQNLKDIYNLDSITIISQKYHNERAVWLADHYGLQSVAYNATTPDIANKKIKNIAREFLARIKMFIDIIAEKL